MVNDINDILYNISFYIRSVYIYTYYLLSQNIFNLEENQYKIKIRLLLNAVLSISMFLDLIKKKKGGQIIFIDQFTKIGNNCIFKHDRHHCNIRRTILNII